MVGEARRPRPEDDSLGALAVRCAGALESLYSAFLHDAGLDPKAAYGESIRLVTQILAVLTAAERIPQGACTLDHVTGAAAAVVAAAESSDCTAFRDYQCASGVLHSLSGLGIFRASEKALCDARAFSSAAKAILRPSAGAPIERIYFQTMPLSWLGSIYQHLLAFRPDETGDALRASQSYRKGRGVFFTPPSLVSYIVEGVVTPILEARSGMFGDRPGEAVAILDPSCGGGDFLSAVIDFLAARTGDQARSELASECVFGIDVDPQAVEIARFSVWASSGFADGISQPINDHLICGNAISARHNDEPAFDWVAAFPDVFACGGFDAVIGNPPYIAAKNGLNGARAAGQSDSYLLFLSEIMRNNLVRPDGLFSMVLPDPMLVRENAAQIRCKLAKEWTILSLLHISEAFPDALVANIVPICRNTPPSGDPLSAARIERAADRHAFLLRPWKTARDLSHTVRVETIAAQDRCEFLYLLEQGEFGSIVRRIHGDNVALSVYQEPFAPLRKLNVKSIYRGEEVGKSAIGRENGDQPMLLGGQSIRPYEITWEGRTANSSWVRKPIERYHSTKVLIQKSSAHVIAAVDRVSKRHTGYVFPQSVYAVELTEHGIDHWYLLCILNSRVINEYIRRTVTGYKLLQPQLELEDIRALPIRRISFTTHHSERRAEVGRGIAIFEREASRRGDFPELANFAVCCLTRDPELSDVVHDILSHLARSMVALTRSNRKSPDPVTTRRLRATREAIETLVWTLYSSEPTQMALPM